MFYTCRCRVGANHLVHSIYICFGLVLEYEKLWGFFHFSGTSHHFVVIHCAQGYNSHSSLADLAEHCKAAIESKLSAVNAPGVSSLHQRKDVCFVLL